jgi:anti-sigma B factor antagonist
MHESAPADPSNGSGGNTVRGLDEVGFSYDVAEGEGRVVVSMHGELDLASAPELQRELVALVGRPVGTLTLDLGGVTFLDSSGLGALYRARQAADEQGVSLRLEAVPDHVRRVLDVTAMAPLFDLRPRTA